MKIKRAFQYWTWRMAAPVWLRLLVLGLCLYAVLASEPKTSSDCKKVSFFLIILLIKNVPKRNQICAKEAISIDGDSVHGVDERWSWRRTMKNQQHVCHIPIVINQKNANDILKSITSLYAINGRTESTLAKIIQRILRKC